MKRRQCVRCGITMLRRRRFYRRCWVCTRINRSWLPELVPLEEDSMRGKSEASLTRKAFFR